MQGKPKNARRIVTKLNFVMQHRHPGLHPDINAAQIGHFAPVRYRRFRRRFYVALFVGMVGLVGFMIILAMILYG